MNIFKRYKRGTFEIPTDKLDRMTHEEAEFYVERVEKQLDDSVDTGKIITERATNMLSLTAGALIALTAYAIGRWEEKKAWDDLLVMSVIGCGFFFLVSMLLVIVITPTTYCISGSRPEILFKDDLWSTAYCPVRRQKNLSINLLKNYQEDIKENNAKNNRRWTLYKISIFLLVTAPMLFIANYLFI